MTKPLISICRVHNEDVIATSSLCKVNLDDYNLLFQCNGVNETGVGITNLIKGVKDGNFFEYVDGKLKHEGGTTTTAVYSDYDAQGLTTSELEDGKWYHVAYGPYGESDYVVECLDPESHHLVK